MGIADHIKNGISRRGFVLGGAAAGAATVLAGCSKKTGTSDDAAGEPQVIKDDSKIVSITDEYEAVDIDLEPAASWTLPLGTLLYYCDGDYAAAMMAPASALHANTLGVLNLGDGSLTTLIEDPIEGTGYAFYDVRAGDGVFAWVEMNFANSSWKLYAQNLSGASLSGDVAELDRGGKDYDPPLFTAFGSSVIWYKMPSAGGNKTSSDSFCYRRSLDESKAEVIWKSMGRFASAPRASDGILTISPRVRNDEGVYYGITAIDLTDGNNTKRAQLVLPSSVSPFEAVYMGDTFVFSIEATYSDVGTWATWARISVMREGHTSFCPASRSHVLPARRINISLRYRHRIFSSTPLPRPMARCCRPTALWNMAIIQLRRENRTHSLRTPRCATARVYPRRSPHAYSLFKLRGVKKAPTGE